MILLDPKLPFLFGVVMIGLLGVYLTVFHATPGRLALPHQQVVNGSSLATCTICHSDDGLDQGCLGCHEEIASQINQGKGYHYSLLRDEPSECRTCHPDHLGVEFPLVNELSWQRLDPNYFDHSHVTFSLTGSHDGLSCDDCHRDKLTKQFALPRFGSQLRDSTFLGLTQNCIDCHEDIHAGGLADQCQQCHSQEAFRPATFFQHDDYYVLEDAHADADCSGCHAIPIRSDVDALYAYDKNDMKLPFGDVVGTACKDCHEDVHAGGLSSECQDCHDGRSFRPASLFQHNDVHVLEGAHVAAECAGCHSVQATTDDQPAAKTKSGDVMLAFDGVLGTTCQDCHETPHLTLPVDDCQRCHVASDETWALGTRGIEAKDHAITGFALETVHGEVSCQQCHPSELTYGQRYRDPNAANYLRRVDTCQGCHEDPHEGQFGKRYPQCLDCHGKDGFVPTQFDSISHEKIYPLAGAHLAVPCIQCHLVAEDTTVRRFVATPSQCKQCHQEPHGEQFQAELLEGDCTTCHQSDAETFAIRPYDHFKRTGYELTGAHKNALCRDCHGEKEFIVSTGYAARDRRYRITPQACDACHDDVHRGQFRQGDENLCQRCHTTASWKADLFDHDRDSRFALEGAHVKVDCQACHPMARQPDGQGVMQYRPLNTQCEDCHGFIAQ